MWKIISSVITGSSHLKSGKPCQDAVKNYSSPNACTIVLADGAGSCVCSEEGANISCSSILSLFCTDFDTMYQMSAADLKLKIIHNIRTRLGMKAKRSNLKKDDFASTLLFVAIQGDQFVAGHVGDGVIGYITTNNQVSLLSEPENGEFANTTFFTISNNYQNHLRLYRGKVYDKKSFFLMSDGAGECLYDKRNRTFAPAINSFSSWLEQFSEEEVNKALYENMATMFTKHTTDDCSFIMCQKKQMY